MAGPRAVLAQQTTPLPRPPLARPERDRGGLPSGARSPPREERVSTEHARNSDARFWVMLAVLALITVVIALTAFHEIQTNFGIFQ